MFRVPGGNPGRGEGSDANRAAFRYEDGFWADFTSDPVEGSGYCERGSCRVCKEGSTRCSTRGISQICRDGAWVRYRADAMKVDLDPPRHHAAYAAAAFTTVICYAVVVSAATGPMFISMPPSDTLAPTCHRVHTACHTPVPAVT
jgi:hypothetical protein